MGFLELARMKVREIESDLTTKNLDDYWLEEILPRLSRLHMAGRLPDLSTCPLWLKMESHWQTKNPDVAKVKETMDAALGTYEGESWN